MSAEKKMLAAGVGLAFVGVVKGGGDEDGCCPRDSSSALVVVIFPPEAELGKENWEVAPPAPSCCCFLIVR